MRHLFALLFLFPAATASAESRVALPILVLVHNYAHVQPSLLTGAEESAARVLETGGVQVHWLDCSQVAQTAPQCQDVTDPSVVVLHLLSSNATRRGAPSGSLGFALEPEVGHALFAGVFFDRVERLSSGSLNEPMILGHAIAHEIGHLLLGLQAHTDSGIMRGEWRLRELERATNGTLVFGASQRNRIAQTLKARFQATHSVLATSTSR